MPVYSKVCIVQPWSYMGGSKAIWAMPVWADNFSKRGFLLHELWFYSLYAIVLANNLISAISYEMHANKIGTHRSCGAITDIRRGLFLWNGSKNMEFFMTFAIWHRTPWNFLPSIFTPFFLLQLNLIYDTTTTRPTPDAQHPKDHQDPQDPSDPSDPPGPKILRSSEHILNTSENVYRISLSNWKHPENATFYSEDKIDKKNLSTGR